MLSYMSKNVIQISKVIIRMVKVKDTNTNIHTAHYYYATICNWRCIVSLSIVGIPTSLRNLLIHLYIFMISFIVLLVWVLVSTTLHGFRYICQIWRRFWFCVWWFVWWSVIEYDRWSELNVGCWRGVWGVGCGGKLGGNLTLLEGVVLVIINFIMQLSFEFSSLYHSHIWIRNNYINMTMIYHKSVKETGQPITKNIKTKNLYTIDQLILQRQYMIVTTWWRNNTIRGNPTLPSCHVISSSSWSGEHSKKLITQTVKRDLS